MTASHLGATRILGPDVCSRILLVGELNPYGARPEYALYHEPPNAAGGRLQRLIFGIEARRWYLPMWRTNLCVGAFDREDARTRAMELIGEAPWSTIVLLGRQVQRAFGVTIADGFGELASVVGPRRALICLPHPSGRNTIWTDLANVDHARAVMRAAVPEIPWGQLGTTGEVSHP